MEKNGKKSCTSNSSHIYICYFMVKYRVDSNNMLIAYCRTDHMLADLFTKALQGALFVKLRELIGGWKYIDTLQMVPPSNKECLANMYKVRSSKEVIKSNAEVKYEKVGRKKSYVDISIQGNKKQNDLRTESSQYHLMHNDDVRPNLYTSNYNANSWSHRKPFDI